MADPERVRFRALCLWAKLWPMRPKIAPLVLATVLVAASISVHVASGKQLTDSVSPSQTAQLRAAQNACADGSANIIVDQVKDLVRCEAVNQGPPIRGQRTFEVRYADATGTNFHVQHVALVIFTAGQPHVVWVHTAFELTSAPLVPRDEATIYRWRYADQGDRIALSGMEVVGTIDDMRTGHAHGQKTTLPAERYCYSAPQRRFEPC
jgi:hypothetical protein